MIHQSCSFQRLALPLLSFLFVSNDLHRGAAAQELVGVGIAFAALMHPTKGAINLALSWVGIDGPAWLSDPALAVDRMKRVLAVHGVA